MDFLSSSSSVQAGGSSVANAVSGLQEQNQRFERNVEEIASSSSATSRDVDSQDKALLEQQEIVANLRSNAKSLEAANQRIGTIVDIEV
ncbi:MAG: hypothetical protein ISR69_03235 [Gammaproteobacteria bacterium]|nr:hypothetical protein [Gammaproteobacteria bacterium]